MPNPKGVGLAAGRAAREAKLAAVREAKRLAALEQRAQGAGAIVAPQEGAPAPPPRGGPQVFSSGISEVDAIVDDYLLPKGSVYMLPKGAVAVEPGPPVVDLPDSPAQVRGAAPAQVRPAQPRVRPSRATLLPDYPDVVALMDGEFKRYFTGRDPAADSWWPWRVYLKAVSGLALDDVEVGPGVPAGALVKEASPGMTELAFFRAHTGRSKAPTKPARAVYTITGRRGGKSQVNGLLAVHYATRKRQWVQAPGELAEVPVIAADRAQARVVQRYIVGLLRSSPRTDALIRGKVTRDRVDLVDDTRISIHTASYRTIRGYTVAGAVADEIAFWRNEETSSNPDKEILTALRPGLLTTGGPLFVTSTPYARRGELWDNYRRHWGVDDDPVLVWRASTLEMHPDVPQEDIAEAYLVDAEAAEAEYGGEFRSDLDSFISAELVQRLVVQGRLSLPPMGDGLHDAPDRALTRHGTLTGLQLGAVVRRHGWNPPSPGPESAPISVALPENRWSDRVV